MTSYSLEENKFVTLLCHQILNPYTYTYQDKENVILSRFILLPSPITRNYSELSYQFQRQNKYAIWREVYTHFHKHEIQEQLRYSIHSFRKINGLDMNEQETNNSLYKILIHDTSTSQSWFHPLLKRTFYNIIVFTVEIHMV